MGEMTMSSIKMSDYAGRGDESEQRHEPRNSNSKEMSSSKSDGLKKITGERNPTPPTTIMRWFSIARLEMIKGLTMPWKKCRDEDKPQKSDSDIEASLKTRSRTMEILPMDLATSKEILIQRCGWSQKSRMARNSNQSRGFSLTKVQSCNCSCILVNWLNRLPTFSFF